jgi:hypothetical protein
VQVKAEGVAGEAGPEFEVEVSIEAEGNLKLKLKWM